MLEMLTKRTDPVERAGGNLLRICEDLLTCRRMADYHLSMEALAEFEVGDCQILNGSRFIDLVDAALDLTVGEDDDRIPEFTDVMQAVEGEVAKLRGRSIKTPWNLRSD